MAIRLAGEKRDTTWDGARHFSSRAEVTTQEGLRMRTSRMIVGMTALAICSNAWAQVPKFSTTLDDDASITSSGGTVQNAAAHTYVAGAMNNAFQSTSSVANAGGFARWNDATVGTLFTGWSSTSGITVDLYFRGDHWSTHSGDSGLWSMVRRSSDAFFITSVRNGKLRLLFNNNTGNTTQYKYTLDGGTGSEAATNVPLADNVTYRLTVRQLNGVFEVYMDGGAYSNASPVFSASNLPTGYTWQLVPSGGSPARQMTVGNRGTTPDFGGTLQAGEWVDHVRIYNGFFTPANIDAGGSPVAVINSDVTTGFVPLTVHFDGSASSDTGVGTITSYAWDFDNDGTVDDSSGPIVSHQYASIGSYVCKLTVTDNDSNTAVSTLPIQVNSLPTTGLLTITAMLPSGALAAGSHPLTSVTAKRVGEVQSFTTTDLTGPPDIAHVEVTGGGITGGGAGATTAAEAMVGLELGSTVAGVNADGKFLAGYFPDHVLVQPDGTGAPEIFFIESSASTDDFQIQLLTNGPGESIAIAATLQVRSVDYASTATVVGGTPRGGVGIDLDAVGAAAIRGIRITGANGFGGGSGVDPCIIAANVKACPTPFADADEDHDVDQADFAAFQRCYTGPTPPSGTYDTVHCFCFNRDSNSVIDEFDLSAFEKCATGPGISFDAQNPPSGCEP